jgi:hypothetical protein
MIRRDDVREQVRLGWQRRGWSAQLLDRALELQVRHSRIKRWVSDKRWTSGRVEEALQRRSKGELVVREARVDDAEGLVDLYANAPEDVGEREVTVERGPFPFAAFQLQEGASLHVLEDGGVLLAAIAQSTRPSVIGGQDVSVHIPLALRVRKDCRGEGLGPIVQRAAQPPGVEPRPATYYYRRLRGGRGATTNVACYRARLFLDDARGIRPARRHDAPACAALINRTHEGCDLFRPLDGERLAARLDGAAPGLSPDSQAGVYGWEDYYVVEDEGRIVACGGLWDRGRDVREVWRDKRSGTQWTVENTALMDFGHARGHEAALARLVAFFIGRTAELGRDSLMAPVEWLPGVAALLHEHEGVPETRALYFQPTPALKQMGITKLVRPYTDLAYW